MKYAFLGLFSVLIGSMLALGGPALAQSNADIQTSSGTQSSSKTAAENIVATQIRSQGYKCDDPSNAQHDKGASSPNETDWILTCDNAVYQVKLVPGMEAEVEKLP